jgi:DNA-binding NtrC family response regulator
MSNSVSLPSSVRRVRDLDPDLYQEVAADFTTLALAGKAMAWAQRLLPRFIAAHTPNRVMSALVDEAKQLTGAPSVWALTWTGDLARNRASFQVFAGNTPEPLPRPAEVSDTVITRVATTGQPVWSDNAQNDTQFTASESVQAFCLQSVGCIPLTANGVLYLQDPEQPGRFSIRQRYKLTVLCRIVTAFMKGPSDVPRRGAAAVTPLPGMVGQAPAMAETYDAVRAFAPMPWSALIVGETGVGKELIAKAFHHLSPRADRPFMAINCSTIQQHLAESILFGHERGAFTGADKMHRGLFERVRDGTLFLDEIGDLDPGVQAKLLRVLQERKYERMKGTQALPFRGRVIAATHRNLDQPEGRDGFREDLYYRLAACVIRVPPLRDRKEDVPAIAHAALRELQGQAGVSGLELGDEAVLALAAHSWDGNVRDLRNALRNAIGVAMSKGDSVLEPHHFVALRRKGSAATGGAPGLLPSENLTQALDRIKTQIMDEALAQCDGNITMAAEKLGITRQWFSRMRSRARKK